MKLHLRQVLFISLMSWCGITYGASDEIVMERVGSWTNVTSFAMSQTADFVVMTQREANGSDLVYESFKTQDGWQVAEPIWSINEEFAGGKVGGLSLTADARRIFFHAKKSGEQANYDIYFVEKTDKGWSVPQMVESISTADNELCPSIEPGDEGIYFLKHQVVADAKLEKKEHDKMSIYYAQKDMKNIWKRAMPVNNALNTGFVQGVSISEDMLTFFYAMRPEKKEASELMFTRVSVGNTWLIPEKVLGDNDGYDYFSPCAVRDQLYFIRSNSKKQDGVGAIYFVMLNEKMTSLPIVNERGDVKKLGTNNSIVADIVLHDPTSFKVLGRYKSDKWNGVYHLTGQASRDYIAEVRSDGYSYNSFILDYKSNPTSQMPKHIELFDTIRLAMSIYDSEIFRPLDSKVIAVRVSDKAIFRSVKIGEGYYLFSLPLGSDYNIIATSNRFVENKFLFKLDGDVVFSRFERQLPLTPMKRDYTIKVVDAETGAPVMANVVLDNMNREEQVTVLSDKCVGGLAKMKLREGDRYELTVGGVRGYSFHNREIDLTKDKGNELVVELIALRAGASVRLNNISFATASADLESDSYVELDRLVKMLEENPSLRIEIAAHTDNVGNAKYNMKLSERRAASVLNYLIDCGVSMYKIKSKGYGMTSPLVPNDSEENKAINRRVEFKILGEE